VARLPPHDQLQAFDELSFREISLHGDVFHLASLRSHAYRRHTTTNPIHTYNTYIILLYTSIYTICILCTCVQAAHYDHFSCVCVHLQFNPVSLPLFSRSHSQPNDPAISSLILLYHSSPLIQLNLSISLPLSDSPLIAALSLSRSLDAKESAKGEPRKVVACLLIDDVLCL
jgi:hypothetical protein